MADSKDWGDNSGAFGEKTPEALKPKKKMEFGLKANENEAGSMKSGKPANILQFKPTDSGNKYNRSTGMNRDSNPLQSRARDQPIDSLQNAVAAKKV